MTYYWHMNLHLRTILVLRMSVKTHSILSRNLLPKNQRGLIRNNPMFVLNSDDRIEYVAAEPNIVKSETEKLFLIFQSY